MKVKASKPEHKIPMFSGYMMRRIRVGSAIFVSAVFVLKFQGMEGNGVAPAVILCMGWLLSYIIIQWCLNRFAKGCMWKLQEDCIRRIILGNVREISYEEIAEALQTKKVKIAMHGFWIPKKWGFITFYYEIGNEGLQKRIKKSYEFLAEKIPAQLPKMSQRLTGQIDRSFLYRKDRRWCSVFMLLASLLMLFVEYESPPTNIVFIILGLYIQFFMLNELFKGIYFGKKTEQKIQEIIGPYPNTELRKVRASYAQMVVIVLLTAALNLFWMFV